MRSLSGWRSTAVRMRRSSSPVSSTASPGRRLSAAPSSHACVVSVTTNGTVVEAAIALYSGRASTSSTVSNVWGCSPGPGMLCTRKPASRVTTAGVTGGVEPGSALAAAAVGGGGSSAKASCVSAATPGRSR